MLADAELVTLLLTNSLEVLPVPILTPSLSSPAGLDQEVEIQGPPTKAQARPLSPLPACSKAC